MNNVTAASKAKIIIEDNFAVLDIYTANCYYRFQPVLVFFRFKCVVFFIEINNNRECLKDHCQQSPQAARLFRAAAEAETVHGHAHLKVMEGIKSTRENLEAAINSETYYHTNPSIDEMFTMVPL